MNRPLLLIEDTPSLQMVYEAILKSAGQKVVTVGTARDGLARFQSEKPAVVLLDLMLPDGDGLTLMKKCLAFDPEAHFIVITAHGSINKAVEAMRAGAYEFLVKPFDDTRLLNAIKNARADIERNRDRSPKATLRKPLIEGFVGSSQIMQDVYRTIHTVSRSMATVFISGESGTGKEICAQAVHRYSNRSGGPFVPLNCGAIPANLLESEVFGHLRGSFAGAIADKPGAAAIADGGTLFLDEICEMDLNLQTKLLRFLQTSTITPVGSSIARKVNVRIVCATNRDPMEEVRLGRFREDLYYRLHVVPIHLPPLRERGDDIAELAATALRQLSMEEGREFTGFTPEVIRIFLNMSWPGNVRQLMNVLRNVVVLNEGPIVTKSMLPLYLLHEIENRGADTPVAPRAENRPHITLDGLAGKTLAEIERLVIEQVLERHNGSVPRAARELDVSPSTLYRKRDAWAGKT